MADPVSDIQRFLSTVAYRGVHPRAPGEGKAYCPFVTISRQTGAGGHTLANTLLEAMRQERGDPLFEGWQVFDRELCEKLLEDPKLNVSLRSLMTEAYRSQIEDAVFSLLGHLTPQEVVVKKLFDAIRTLATLGRVIIVGRAGACVTRGLPDGVHVRLVASEPIRIRRMMELFHLSEVVAREMVDKQDRDRTRLVRDYFYRDIHDPLLYDAT